MLINRKKSLMKPYIYNGIRLGLIEGLEINNIPVNNRGQYTKVYKDILEGLDFENIDSFNIRKKVVNSFSAFNKEQEIIQDQVDKLMLKRSLAVKTIHNMCIHSGAKYKMPDNNIWMKKFLKKCFKDLSHDGHIDLNWIDISNVTWLTNVFEGCLCTHIDVSSWDITNVNMLGHVFYKCPNLVEINMSGWGRHKSTYAAYMFGLCPNLRTIYMDNFDTSCINNFCFMFAGCKNLQYVNVSNWNMENATDISFMFWNCNNINNLDVSNWRFKQLSKIDSIFENCQNLNNLIGINNWSKSWKYKNIPQKISSWDAFENCPTKPDWINR